MSEQQQAVFEAALMLPEKMRALLAERLWESLLPEASDLSDAEWLKELERRDLEFDNGAAESIDWSELKKQAGLDV